MHAATMGQFIEDFCAFAEMYFKEDLVECVKSKIEVDNYDLQIFGSEEVLKKFRIDTRALSNRVQHEMGTRKIWQPARYSMTKAIKQIN